MIGFLKELVRYFETHHVQYMLSGSVAMSLYTQPRFTRDYDFIVHLNNSDIPGLVSYFREGYYCDEDSIKEAIRIKGMFNIIDHKTNYKADIVILKDEEYRKTEFDRRRKVKFLDMMIDIVSPEDLLISKLIWIQEIQSSIQMEDIRILSANNDLDRDYINRWIRKLKLNTFGLISL